LTSVRRWHSYVGLFIAPSVLFFALTGAVQLYGLHEAHGNYRPAALIEKLSSVHKDQVFKFGGHHQRPPSEADAPKSGEELTSQAAAGNDGDKTELSTLALKAFFLLVSLCLVLSTVLGLWMGLTQTRQKGLAWTLVLAGALIPAVLLLF
jgi:hypothetical protein